MLGGTYCKDGRKILQQHKTADNHYCKVVCCVLVMQLYLLWFLQMSRFRGVLLLNIELFMLSNFQ